MLQGFRSAHFEALAIKGTKHRELSADQERPVAVGKGEIEPYAKHFVDRLWSAAEIGSGG